MSRIGDHCPLVGGSGNGLVRALQKSVQSKYDSVGVIENLEAQNLVEASRDPRPKPVYLDATPATIANSKISTEPVRCLPMVQFTQVSKPDDNCVSNGFTAQRSLRNVNQVKGKKRIVFRDCLFLVLWISCILIGNLQAQNLPQSVPDYGIAPLSFIPNEGQYESSVLYSAQGSGYSIWLSGNRFSLNLPRKQGGNVSKISLELAETDSGVRIQALDKQKGISNFLIGDSSRWKTRIPNYGRIRYSGVYPGIDLEFYGKQQELEYDFIVRPGSDFHRIAFCVRGGQVSLTGNGGLQMKGPEGMVHWRAPVAYQLSHEGSRIPVASRYVVSDNEVRFILGQYDPGRDVIIDPVLEWSTFTGGTTTNLTGLAVDSRGSAYITGFTFSADYPVTPGAFQTMGETTGSFASAGNESTMVFVSKFSPDGRSLEYSTFLSGTSFSNGGLAIAVDDAGNAWVTGSTNSIDFPTKHASQPFLNGGWIFSLSAGANHWRNLSAGIAPAGVLQPNPSRAGEVYAANSTGFYRSTDGGAHWILSNSGLTNLNIHAIAPDPGNANVVYVGTDQGVFSSRDGGSTWSALPVPVSGFLEAGPASFPIINWIHVTQGSPSTVVINAFNPIGFGLNFISRDGGLTWQTSNPPQNGSTLAPLSHYVETRTSSRGADVIYALATLDAELGFLAIAFSSDGGLNFFITNFPTPVADARALTVDPSNGDILYVGTQGGVVKSVDGGKTFSAVNTGLPVDGVQINDIVAIDRQMVYASSSLGIFVTHDAGSTWTMLSPQPANEATAILAFSPVDRSLYTISGEGASDAFLTKLNATGSDLIYSTFLGGSGEDSGSALVHANGVIYVTGNTASPDLPTTAEAFQRTSPGLGCGMNNPFVLSFCNQAFIAGWDAKTGVKLLATYFGGNGNTNSSGIATDSSGDLYITGGTDAANLPLRHAFRKTCAIENGRCSQTAYVAKFDGDADRLKYSTYLGSGQPAGIAVDSGGSAFVAGTTSALDYPVTPHAFKSSKPGQDTAEFATRLAPEGNQLIYSTYLGGTGSQFSSRGTDSPLFEGDGAGGIVVDHQGNAFVVGFTFSQDLPTQNPLQASSPAGDCSDDVFQTPCPTGSIQVLNPHGTALIFGSYFGGSQKDGITAAALDREENLYVAGNTGSANFPVTAGAFDTTNQLPDQFHSSGFVSKISLSGDEPCRLRGPETATFCSPAQGGHSINPVEITAGANVPDLTIMRLYVDNRPVFETRSSILNFALTVAAGRHHLVVVAYNSNGKAFTDSREITVGEPQ